MLLWTFFLGISLTPSSPGLGRNKPERRASTAPIWQFDLRFVGYPRHLSKRETLHLQSRANPLCFSDHGVLIATFLTQQDVSTLARRDQPSDPLPLRLHAAFLDVVTGKVQAKRDWYSAHPAGGIIVVGEGKFVVFTPAVVSLYSPNLELVKEFKLSSEQQSHVWDFHSSLTGKVILVEYHYPEAKYQWLDTDTLLPQSASWSESLPVLSVSDDKEITSFRDTYIKAKGTNIFEAIIQPRNGAERTVCREFAGEAGSCWTPYFVSNDVLALWMPHELSVVPRTGGDALLKATFRYDEWLGSRLYPSADGKRFAVTVSAQKGGSSLLDIGFHSVLKHIVVYDLPSGRAIYTLDARQQKIKDVSGVALSPDGSLMAILTDGIVEVYQLPSGHPETVGLKDPAVHMLQVTFATSKPKR